MKTPREKAQEDVTNWIQGTGSVLLTGLAGLLALSLIFFLIRELLS